MDNNMENPAEEPEIAAEMPEEEKGTKTDVAAELLDWVKVLAIAVVAALLINHFLIANARIPSGSMEDTIMTGNRLIGLRTAYWFSEPKRGDIAIFLYPDDETKTFIKRVIGLPGEKVEIRGGLVYINDSDTPLKEDYIKGVPSGDFGPFEVPEDSYFMLGDNRHDSKDSRFWINHYVKKEKILAKAMFRYFPSIKWLADTPDYGQ